MQEKMNSNDQLSLDDIFIMKTQNYFIECGFQWREQIYNDGLGSECYLVISRDDDPTVFESNPKNTMGWGRFGRRSCWEQALNYVDQVIER